MSSKNDNNPHVGHRKRLKQQLDNDAGKSLNDITFLEALLFFSIPQGDTNPLAHRLLDKFGSFDKVLEANKEELMSVDGIGEHTAYFLHTYLSTFSRYLERKAGSRFEYGDIEKIRLFVNGKYLNKTTETAMLLNFDSKGNFSNSFVISEGDLSSAELDKKEIARAVINDNAVYAILVHNHPSGIVSPSTEDIKCVEELSDFLKMFSVTLVDNIIVTHDDFLAFSQNKRYVKYLYA